MNPEEQFIHDVRKMCDGMSSAVSAVEDITKRALLDRKKPPITGVLDPVKGLYSLQAEHDRLRFQIWDAARVAGINPDPPTESLQDIVWRMSRELRSSKALAKAAKEELKQVTDEKNRIHAVIRQHFRDIQGSALKGIDF